MASLYDIGFNPRTMFIDEEGQIRLKDPDASRAMLAAKDNTALDFSKYKMDTFPVTGILDTNQANMFYDRGEIDELTEAMPEEEDDEGGITKLLNFLNPLGFIQNMFGTPQPYQQFTPGYNIDSRGIVNVAGVSTPYNMFGGDFYNPRTGLNRFDRAAQRYAKTGSTADLFASSRTGTEFFRKLRERKAAKQKAVEEAAKAKRNITTFTGGDDRANIPIGPNNTGSRIGAADIPDRMRGSPQQYATDDIADFF